MLIFYIILFLAACVILAKSGTLVVKSLTRIAAFYRLSEFLVAFVLVGFATSAPELFVGISSAISNSPNLSLGNLVGSNIINVTLVVGLAAILGRGIGVSTRIARRDVYYSFIMLILPLILLFDGVLSRIDGLILLVLFLLYLGQLFYFYQRRLPIFIIKILSWLKMPVNGERFQGEFEESDIKEKPVREVAWEFLFFILGVILLLASAWLIVFSGITLAGFLKLPVVLLGLVVVSIGTALPELTFGVRAVLAGKKEMILGNMFGAMIIHLVFILGLVSLIRPIVLSDEGFLVFLCGALAMFVFLGLFSFFIRSKERLSWQEGMILVLLYIMFLGGALFLRGFS